MSGELLHKTTSKNYKSDPFGNKIQINECGVSTVYNTVFVQWGLIRFPVTKCQQNKRTQASAIRLF